MIDSNLAITQEIQNKIDHLTINEFHIDAQNQDQHQQKVQKIIEASVASLNNEQAQRIINEFAGWGPLETLFQDQEITEILLNGKDHIWFEKKGQLYQHHDSFYSNITFRNFLDRLCQKANTQFSVQNPTADAQFEDFRLSLIGHEITHKGVHLSFRRHPKNPWNFARLAHSGWCQEQDLQFFEKIIQEKMNFIVIGSTGSGKTSVLNAFLQKLPANERVVSIEDTSELALPNSASMKLLTREDSQGILPSIDQNQLVKRALRLRPDRIVMGEVRGVEAKDFLMALATGHTGSFGTLHAHDAHQALIRLEMLIQMGAPQWSLQAIRRLIHLSLKCIIVTNKTHCGQRVFNGVYEIKSLEEHGFVLEPWAF